MKKVFIAMSVFAVVALAATPALAQGANRKPTQAENANSPVPGKPGNLNIVEIAVATNQALGEFDYLLGAIGCLTDEATGSNPVVELLSGSDMYTVFAPIDDAFIALQQALGITTPSPEATCALGDETVFNVLAYHVTAGRRFSNSVFNAQNPKMIEMLNGGYVTANPDVTLTDFAGQSVGIVAPLFNINAKNGVIHVINTVLLPF